jgi:hypothetical protein
MVYLSLVQYYFPTAVLYVRTAGDPEAVAGTVRREVQSLDRNLVLQVESLETSIGELLWAHRLSAGVLAVFGALALLLATIGIYGVISYSVRQRTREIGVRLALGATVGEVRRMILREGVRLVAIGRVVRRRGVTGGGGECRRHAVHQESARPAHVHPGPGGVGVGGCDCVLDPGDSRHEYRPLRGAPRRIAAV